MNAERLLIVDDDPSVAALIEKVARRQGFETLVLYGASGFEETRQGFDPDVIVLDILMPEADGIELIRQLGATACRSKVVLISGSDPFLLECAQLLGEAYGLASVECLRKPIGLDALRAALIA